ncbi:hypothetical protein QCA50_017814 [Cerrena zonata]|uniref:Uncharacterized protein n=1 Tax=Cerrena zonata TaxID=2478898 RepID=A0AAW0FEX5_9APHY
MTWSEFINDVVASAQRWFGAHMVVLAYRPSIKLKSRFAQSIHETRPVKLTERKWIDSHEDGQWSWFAKDYLTWPLTLGEATPNKPLLIMFDTEGEPLLPSLTTFTTAEQHRDVLHMFLTTHYKLATCDPASAPPYIHMSGNGPLLLECQYLPDTDESTAYDVYLRKPGSLRGAQRYAFLSHLYARQERYLSGESILVFRWKSIKGPGKVVTWEPAKYSPQWMLQFAMKHGTIRAPLDLGAPPVTPNPTEPARVPDAGPSSSRSRNKRKEKRRKQVTNAEVSEREDDPFQSGSEDETDDDDRVEGMVVDSEGEDFTSALDAVSSDEGEELARQSAARATNSKGKSAIRPPHYTPLSRIDAAEQPQRMPLPRSATHAQQQVRFGDENNLADDEEEDKLDFLFNLLPGPTSPQVSTISVESQPPSWTENRLDRKMQYVRAIAPDPHFLALVDWYEQSAALVVLPASPFEWASWGSDAAHLPEDVHCRPGGAAKAVGIVNSWRKSSNKRFNELPSFELLLLTSALIYRDVKAAAFHEQDDPKFPLYFNQSVFTRKQYDGLRASFKYIAEELPIEALNPKRVPKPRKKVTEKAKHLKDSQPGPSQPPVSTPHNSDTEDARGLKRVPESPTTPRKGKGRKKQKEATPTAAVRRGTRERTAPKSFDDDVDTPLAPAAHRGRGRGATYTQRGKNQPKRGGATLDNAKDTLFH